MALGGVEGDTGAGIEEGGNSFLLATGGLLLFELSLVALCPVREEVRTRGTPVLALIGVLTAAEWRCIFLAAKLTAAAAFSGGTGGTSGSFFVTLAIDEARLRPRGTGTPDESFERVDKLLRIDRLLADVEGVGELLLENPS